MKKPNFETASEVLPFSIENIYPLAQEKLQSYQIQMDSFSDLYSSEVILADKKEVERRKKGFEIHMTDQEKELRKLAEVLEAIILYHGEQSNWFGSEATLTRTTDYDDLTHGTDCIMELTNPNNTSQLALAIDATFSSHVGEKLIEISNEIIKGELTRIKYYISDQAGIRGELINVPRIIVGLDTNSIMNISDLWLNNANEHLANHPAQFQILEEIMMQCEFFSRLAIAEDQVKIGEIYRKIYEKIKTIYSAKKAEGNDNHWRDSSHANLKRVLPQLFPNIAKEMV